MRCRCLQALLCPPRSLGVALAAKRTRNGPSSMSPHCAQAVEVYVTLREQLTTIRDHLQQARREYDALTGSRGMEQLGSGTEWNYLPREYDELNQVLAGASPTFGSLLCGCRAISSRRTDCLMRPN